eukprot:TRINITY_DN1681_c0_g1_i10.p2 TRINITY_DN1681_c0_g1~~TRINITY_DN1681_c0_g1_i10.p2  ORF type:complete len:321 (+),score=59.13 TRINITY_DN1681_c0_g1_i10:293-1255(+)
MSVSVETVAAVVPARHSPPYGGGHAGAGGAPANGGGGGGGGGGGRHGGGRRGLDASHSWSPSPTSIVSAHRGRGGGGSGKRGGGNDAPNDGGAGEGGRGMPPRHHGADPAPLVEPTEGRCGSASGSLATLPLAPRPIVGAGAAVGKAGPPPLGIVGATVGREAGWRPAAKVAAVGGGAVGTPVAHRPSPTAASGRVEPLPVRPEPHAYMRVPTEDGGAAGLAGRAGATTPSATPAALGPLGARPPAAAIGDAPSAHRESVAARGTLAERGPLVVHHSHPEEVAGDGASSAVGNTKASVGAPRFLASLANRVQVLAERGRR